MTDAGAIASSLPGFSLPRPFARGVDVADNKPGVQVVWGPDGEALYVGRSDTLRDRIRQHRTGPRDSSVLHKKVGELLDVQLGHAATTEEIQSFLDRCTTSVRHTTDTATLKAEVIRALHPRFNELIPKPPAAVEQAVAPSALFNGSPTLHLILRWRLEHQPLTITYHREVAEREGSVWWRKVGAGTAPSAENFRRLRDQIAAGVPTYAFIRRAGEVWRVTLKQVERGSYKPPAELVPDYYQPALAQLWFWMTDFTPLPGNWPENNLVFAQGNRQGDAVEFTGQNAMLLVNMRTTATMPEPTPVRAITSNSEVEKTKLTPTFGVGLVTQLVEDRGLVLPPGVVPSAVAALNSGKHVILTGPPGTAKTTFAEVLARAASMAELCAGHRLTTATSDWTTFETIGGLRPTSSGGLAFSPGQFLRAIRDNEWLVVDELNRSNFDRAFGQLFTVLAGQGVELPYEDADSGLPIEICPAETAASGPERHRIEVPAPWRMIATMNVFDKTLLFEMSYALMRRFCFIEIAAPDDAAFRLLIEASIEDPAQADTVISAIEPLFALRAIKEFGPALFLDMARFAEHRLNIDDPGVSPLRFQLFYSYLLPQFEGLTDRDGVRMTKLLRPHLAGPERRRLAIVLRDVLGIEPGPAEGQPNHEDDGGDVDQLDGEVTWA